MESALKNNPVAYASVAFLEHGAVEQHQWLTSSQLLDGVAVSVATPGPFMLSATFVGLLADGVAGAIIATFFVFLPSLKGLWPSSCRKPC